MAYNTGTSPLEVTFHDAQSGAVLAVLTVQPRQMVTQLASGQLINDSLGQARAPSTGSTLYLKSSAGGSTLSSTPGTAVPTSNGNPLDISNYTNTFADVPANPNNTNTFPAPPTR